MTRVAESVPQTPSRGLRTWLKIGFGVAVVIAAVAYVVREWNDFSSALTEMGLVPVLASLPLAFAACVTWMFAWRALLADLGHQLNVREAGRVFFASQLGKYLPGSVWTLVAQVELGREARVPRATSFAVGVLALVLSLAVGIIVAVGLLPFGAGDALADFWWIGLAAPLMFVFLHPKVTVGLLNRVLRLARRTPITTYPTWPGMLRATVWQTVGWLLMGLHCYALVLGFEGQEALRTLPLAVGGFALAFCVGVLFIPAPAGAGIREVALGLALATVLTQPQVAAVVLVSRVLLVAVDCALAALWWAGRRPTGVTGAVPDEGEREVTVPVEPAGGEK